MLEQVAEFMRGEGYDVRAVRPAEDDHADLVATSRGGMMFLEVWPTSELPVGQVLQDAMARGAARAAAGDSLTRSAVILSPGEHIMPADALEPLARARMFIVRFDPIAWTMRPA